MKKGGRGKRPSELRDGEGDRQIGGKKNLVA